MMMIDVQRLPTNYWRLISLVLIRWLAQQLPMLKQRWLLQRKALDYCGGTCCCWRWWPALFPMHP